MKLRSIYPVLLVPLLVGILITAILRFSFFPFTHAAPLSGRVTLPSNTSIFTNNSQLVAPMTSSQPITLAIGLSLRNAAGLAAYLQQITLAHSPFYHHYLSSATFNALYAPSLGNETAISNFLQLQGFKITATYPNHLMLDV